MVDAPLSAARAAFMDAMLQERGGRVFGRIEAEEAAPQRVHVLYTALDLLGNPTYSGEATLEAHGGRTRLTMVAPTFHGSLAAWKTWSGDALGRRAQQHARSHSRTELS